MHSYPVKPVFRFAPAWPAWWRGATVAALVFSSGACSHQSAPAAPEATAPGATVAPSLASSGFDAARAFGLLQAQCDFGPRPPGSAAHEKCRDFLKEQLRPVVDELAEQQWTQPIPRGPGAGRSYAMTNFLGVIRRQGASATDDWGSTLMLCAHWDTRPVADMDAERANRTRPILGANDGASGVAVLLEMARVLKARRPAQTIIIALWDGEDLGEFFYGARHFAQSSTSPEWKKWRPARAILLDMIGDRNLQCNRELNSVQWAPDLWNEVMRAAADSGQGTHFEGESITISDDHVALHQAGIPAIDLIDFSYPAWHTLSDTPDKCSAASLQVIGDVLLRVAATTGRV